MASSSLQIQHHLFYYTILRSKIDHLPDGLVKRYCEAFMDFSSIIKDEQAQLKYLDLIAEIVNDDGLGAK